METIVECAAGLVAALYHAAVAFLAGVGLASLYDDWVESRKGRKS